ncbi:hypothetical protein GF386_04345 [Candidatus Pacearchaeota archaeon]|nr:hypothetical protein [Candidatus Pacearchaeota archaeon]
MNLLAIITMTLGIVSSLSFLFQTLKIIHLHESKDIALLTYLVLFITAVFWLLYGISIRDTPLIASYTVGTLCTFSVIVVYFFYKNKDFKNEPKKTNKKTNSRRNK